MKKRKILVSIALASACLFSLAACGGEEATTTPAPATTTTTTPAPTTTTTAQDTYAVKYVARFSDGADNEELTSLATTVAKGGKVTQPATAPTKDGYTFLGYKTNLNKDFDFANTTITKATTIYAYFDKITNYHTLVADTTNNIIAEDFNAKDAEDTFPEFTSYGTKGLYHSGGGSIVYTNYKAELRQDGTASKMIVDFGGSIENSIIKTSFEFTMAEEDNYSFLMVSTADSSDPVFGLGMAGDSNGRFLRYKDPNGDDKTTTTSISAGKAYTVDLTIDQPAKKVTVKLNGTAITELNEKVFSGLLSSARGLEFQTKASKCNLTVNNIAVNIEAASLDAVKAGAKADLQSYYDAYVATDKDDKLGAPEWQGILDAKTAGDTAIESATDIAAVESALSNAKTAIDTALTTLRATKKAALKDYIEHYTYADDASADIAAKYAAITDATKKQQIDTALATLIITAISDDEMAKITTIKKGYQALANFEKAAEELVAEKVDVTVKYYKYQYTEAEGITAWAADTTYYTEKDGEYTVVDQTAVTAPESGKKYYTRAIVSAGTDATFKTIKGEKITADKVPALKGFFVVDYFTSATLDTKFDFTSDDNKFEAATTIYVNVTNTAKWYRSDYNGHENNEKIPDNYELAGICKIVNGTGSNYAKNKTSKVDGVQTTDCIGFSFEKGKAYLQIDVEEGTTAVVTVIIGSDGSSNKTDKIYLTDITTSTPSVVKTGIVLNKDSADEESSFESSTGEIKVKGTDGKTSLTLTLTAGSYKLGDSSDSAKAFRIQGVTSTISVA